MVVELSTTQFQVCQEANSQFCSITTPIQPLANPPSYVAALYARNTADITSQCSLQIWKASDVNLPTQISPDVWILMTPLSTPASTIMLICPEKSHRNHHHMKTCIYLETTYGLQCHFIKFLPTT